MAAGALTYWSGKCVVFRGRAVTTRRVGYWAVSPETLARTLRGEVAREFRCEGGLVRVCSEAGADRAPRFVATYVTEDEEGGVSIEVASAATS